MAAIFAGATITTTPAKGAPITGEVLNLVQSDTGTVALVQTEGGPVLVPVLGKGAVRVTVDHSSLDAQGLTTGDGTSEQVYGVPAATVRAWCASVGMVVNARGRLAPEVFQAYADRPAVA